MERVPEAVMLGLNSITDCKIAIMLIDDTDV